MNRERDGEGAMASYLRSVDFAFQVQAALAKGTTTTRSKGLPVAPAPRGR